MKKNGFSLVWVLVIVSITSIISALATGVIIYNDNKISNDLTYADLSKDDDLNQFLKVYANLSEQYYENVNNKDMLDKAIAAMMDYLDDDYSNYLNDETTAELMQQLDGKYKGIGLSLNNETKAVLDVFDDTPASRAGITVGDIIVGVNDIDTTNMSASDVVDKIKEIKGTFILKLNRNGQIISTKLKSEEIINPSISYKLLDNNTIGYLKISTFSATLNTQVTKALNELESQKMTSLIIDLRDNTGGYLTTATDVASKFMEKGRRIYSLNNKDSVENFDDETSEKRSYPIVVLINSNTASASEILAGALKQSYGAILVGEKSYGKGKVQQTMKLEDGSMVKYTSAYWLLPDGSCIDRIGLIPDYTLSNDELLNEDGTVNTSDVQLIKAIELLGGSVNN